MSTVSEIIETVKSFGVEEKEQFPARLSEVDFDYAWDRQLISDAQAGRLNRSWQRALEDIKTGKTKPLDEVLSDVP